MKTKALHVDCMEYMKTLEDGAFELAIVDPPYGIGDKLLIGGETGVVTLMQRYKKGGWEDTAPDSEYFEELFRVSRDQIIWGGNYFDLPPTRGVICWDKNNGHPLNFSHWELGWTSFDCIARKVKITSNTGGKIHPTQKPVALYRWLLTNYAKPGDRILDTHLGSQSSRIACEEMGFEFVGCELDKDYFDEGNKRFNQWYSQGNLFREAPKKVEYKQTSLLD